jgi:Coenzyme PQQ synthesis protein D (PqqD)
MWSEQCQPTNFKSRPKGWDAFHALAHQRDNLPLPACRSGWAGGGREGTAVTEFSLSDNVVWCEVGDEVVALDDLAVNYVSTNGTGGRLWKALADGATRDELIQDLVDAYGIDAQQAGDDVDRFLADLTAAGLLRT